MSPRCDPCRYLAEPECGGGGPCHRIRYQPSDGFDDGCCDCLDNDPDPCGHHAWLYNEGITG